VCFFVLFGRKLWAALPNAGPIRERRWDELEEAARCGRKPAMLPTLRRAGRFVREAQALIEGPKPSGRVAAAVGGEAEASAKAAEQRRWTYPAARKAAVTSRLTAVEVATGCCAARDPEG